MMIFSKVVVYFFRLYPGTLTVFLLVPLIFRARLVLTFFWYLYPGTLTVFLPPFFDFLGFLVLSLHIAIFLALTFLHDQLGGILNPFILTSLPMKT